MSSALRRLDGRPTAKCTGHALNARMLGSPLLACFRIICAGLLAVVVCTGLFFTYYILYFIIF